MGLVESLTRAHGGLPRASLRGLPPANQERKPRANEPEEMLDAWADRILDWHPQPPPAHTDFGSLERWHEGLVSGHMTTCSSCQASVPCTVQAVLDKWVTEGVSLRPFLRERGKLNEWSGRALLQAHLAPQQLEHMEELVVKGVAEVLPARKGLEVVSNFFLVGAGDPHEGTKGVGEVVTAAGLAGVAQEWLETVQSHAKERLVMDFKGLNVNAEPYPFQYDSIQRLQGRVPKGSKLAVLDLSSAFHLVALNPDSWDLCGLRHRDSYWRMRRLPFGYSVAPAICSIFTAEVSRQIQAKFADLVHEIVVYLDDFLLVLASYAEEKHLHDICDYVNSLGGKIKAAKCQGPSQSVTFVGFDVHVLVEHESVVAISMSPAKRKKLNQELGCVLAMLEHDEDGLLFEAVRSLSGRLQWYWPALAASSSYMAGLYGWIRWARGRRAFGRAGTASDEQRLARLQHAQDCLRFWQGRLAKLKRRWLTIPAYKFIAMVDASRAEDGSCTFGGVLYRSTTRGWIEQKCWEAAPLSIGDSSQACEMEAVMTAWAAMFTGPGVVCCDSAAAVTACAKGYTRKFDAEEQQRLAAHLENKRGARHVVWIPRTANTLADSLSRSHQAN